MTVRSVEMASGRHPDGLMEYAARRKQNGMALADGEKERTGADG